MKEHSQEYIEYLDSPEWREKRKLVLQRAKDTNYPSTKGEISCERCKIYFPAHELQIHHKTYDNLGDEPLDDLLAVCCICHFQEDKNRKNATVRRKRESAVDTFMTKKYGEEWWVDHEDTEARRWLARKRGEEFEDD